MRVPTAAHAGYLDQGLLFVGPFSHVPKHAKYFWPRKYRKGRDSVGGLRAYRAKARAGNAGVPERVPPHRGSLTHARPSCTAASTRSALGELVRKLKKCNAARAASCRIPRGSPTAGGCPGTSSVCSGSGGAATAAASARLGSSQRPSSSAGSGGRRGCMVAGGGSPRGRVDGESWRGAPGTGFAVLAEIGYGGHTPPPPGRRSSSPPLSELKDQKAPPGERVREHVPDDAVRGDMGQWDASLRAHPDSSSGNLACRLWLLRFRNPQVLELTHSKG